MFMVPGASIEAVAGARAGSGDVRPETMGERALAHGAELFTAGDARRGAYRVLSGALCHYLVWPDGRHDVIEFAFPGDIIGFGFHARHVSTCHAVADTRVQLLTDADLDAAIASNAELATRVASAADREFEVLRCLALGRGQRTPLQRVASYLLAVAREGCRSGDMLTGGGDHDTVALANLLEIGRSDVQASLDELVRRELIARGPDGVILKDACGLEALADR